MDILMEIPGVDDNENNINIRMSDGANLLVNEIKYDSSNKKVNFKYSVYDLKEYFNDNEYVLNNDGTWTGKEDQSLTLKSVYKNIDDSQKENKEVVYKTLEQPREEVVENVEVKNNNNSTQEVVDTKNNKPEENYDYREHDPSWKKGNGDWYYFDDKDRKVTSGWIQNNGKWYYFDENGVMQKNALVIEHGCEFYIDENGELINSNDNNNEKYLKDKSKEDHQDNKVIYRRKQNNEENKDKESKAEEEENNKKNEEDYDNIDSQNTASNEVEDKEKDNDKED